MNNSFLGGVGSDNAKIVLSITVMLLAGFLMTRITKKLRLPNVTGYILAGVAIGPWALNLIPQSVISGMDFVTDVALAFIAFGVGRFFKISELRKNGTRVIVITLTEALTAGVFITLTMYYLFHYSFAFSLLLGSIGCATAPASTVMTIRQYHAKGEFVNTILEVVALDDAVALIAFSVSAALLAEEGAEGSGAQAVMLPILYNLAGLAAGIALGFVTHWIADPESRSNDHRLVLVITMILLLTGLCTSWNISPLLSCMALGTTYINAGGSKKTFKMVSRFTPPVLLLFFVLSGMRLSLPALKTAGAVGVVYLFVRILGKYAGAWAGAVLTHASEPVKKYLGLALIPQAGVSIGLAVLAQRILPADTGVLLTTIILSSGVLYEMIGPACAKASLFLSGSVTKIPEGAAAKPLQKTQLPEKAAAAARAEEPQPKKNGKKSAEKKKKDRGPHKKEKAEALPLRG